jgi:hypothetical protein
MSEWVNTDVANQRLMAVPAAWAMRDRAVVAVWHVRAFADVPVMPRVRGAADADARDAA